MGINYSAQLIVGAEFNALPESIRDVDDIYDWMDKHNLEYACSWYDSGREGMTIGISVGAPTIPVTAEWIASLNEAYTRASFILQTEVQAIITPDIW